MDSSLLFTVINTLLYSGTFLYYFRKSNRNNVGILLLALYLISAIFGIIAYTKYGYCNNNIGLFPYIYLFLVLFSAFNPILRYDDTRLSTITPFSSVYINIIASFLVLLFVPATINILFVFVTTFREAIVNISVVTSLYDDTAEMIQSDGQSGSVIGIIRGIFSEIIIFYTGFYLTLKKKNKLILILLLFSSVYPLLINFMLGSRTSMTYWIIEVLIVYALFKNFLNNSTKKLFKTVVICLLSFFLVVVTILTIGRFTRSGSLYDPLESVVLYAGQPMLNFNAYVLDEDVCQYGDNTGPIFRKMLGLESSDNLFERQAKWAVKMKAPQGAFYTFIGDLCFDYGFFVVFFLILIVAGFFYERRSRSNNIHLYKLFSIFFWACLCCNGLFYFSYKTVGGNLKIICSVLFYCLLRFIYSTATQSVKK